MLELDDDDAWDGLTSGLGTAYDPRPALARLEAGAESDAAWNELWDELHHQGDVGSAAYAAVPHIMRIYAERDVPDWNPLAVVTTVALSRRSARSAPVPESMREPLDDAIRAATDLALRDLRRSDDPEVTRTALGAVALGRGLLSVARVLAELTDDELDEIV